MSYSFEIDGEIVWDPSLRIGQWYLAFSQAAAELLACPTGLTPLDNGTCVVGIPVFRSFVDALLDCYSSTRHPVQHAFIRGVLLASLIILERGGVMITPRSQREEGVMSEMAEFARSM